MPRARCQNASHGLPFLLLSDMLCNWESQEGKAVGYFLVWLLLNIRRITLPRAELQASTNKWLKTKQLCPPSTSSFNIFNYWLTKCESSKEWVPGLGSCLTKQVHLSRSSSQESRGHLCFHNWMSFSLLTQMLYRGKSSKRKTSFSASFPNISSLGLSWKIWRFSGLEGQHKMCTSLQWSSQQPCCPN